MPVEVTKFMAQDGTLFDSMHEAVEPPNPGLGSQSITLRDIFAGFALAMTWTGRANDMEYEPNLERLAANAYKVADAMLAARIKNP